MDKWLDEMLRDTSAITGTFSVWDVLVALFLSPAIVAVLRGGGSLPERAKQRRQDFLSNIGTDWKHHPAKYRGHRVWPRRFAVMSTAK